MDTADVALALSPVSDDVIHVSPNGAAESAALSSGARWRPSIEHTQSESSGPLRTLHSLPRVPKCVSRRSPRYDPEMAHRASEQPEPMLLTSSPQPTVGGSLPMTWDIWTANPSRCPTSSNSAAPNNSLMLTWRAGV
jgi:hypothetical protein